MLDASYVFLVFASVFFITDPFANIPIFTSFLENISKEDRAKTIRKSYLVALVSFFVFSFFGPLIFGFLNIEFFSFKIAGGILLMIISIEMLLGLKTRTELTPTEREQAEDKENIAITPMAIPLITGPGAITTGIVLFSRAQTPLLAAEFVVASSAAFFAGLIMVLQSEKITKLFGPIGLKLVTRIMGLLMLSLSVQFILNGIKEAMALPF